MNQDGLATRHGRIIRQELKPNGVVTSYEDGSSSLLPYAVTDDGQRYVDLFPNDLEETRSGLHSLRRPLPRALA